ncbi:hypothetical protein M0R45_006776 [Rubus argutus]|uniref:Uncharacterized protein n=1 Tax=Rubus argutus TaxID=59490 RepID=A0AAW1YS30_RUBAR
MVILVVAGSGAVRSRGRGLGSWRRRRDGIDRRHHGKEAGSSGRDGLVDASSARGQRHGGGRDGVGGWVDDRRRRGQKVRSPTRFRTGHGVRTRWRRDE